MAATTTAEPRSLLFRCQACAAVLDLSGAPEDAAPSSSFSTATKLDPTRGGGSQTPVDTMDESFMVLPGSASGGHSGGSAGLPAWAKGGTVMTGGTGRGAGDGLAATNQKQASRPKKNTPESFVVLSNSVSRVASHGTDGGTEDTVAGLNARVAALARIFDLASDETSADHPMCLECAKNLSDEINARAVETERECEIHRRCLEDLVGERGDSMDDTPYASNLQRLETELQEEERAVALETEALQLRLDTLTQKSFHLELESKSLDLDEQNYFHSFNDFKKDLKCHVDQRDAVVTQVEQVGRQLERLNRVNVANDAFHVWFDGPFGTVNGFRLGRLPNVNVEWDEINAAWGMACLLLSTMAGSVGLRFKNGYTLKPMGSFSKVKDSKGVLYELYGPVNILSSHRYDKAMTGFLQCLKEFETFAQGVDRQNDDRGGTGQHGSSSNYFKLPYQIDGDKIDGRKIGFPFSRYERWTAALKIMLVDLKSCLAWVANQS